MTTARFSEKGKQGNDAVIKHYLVNKCDRYTIELRPQSDGAITMLVLEYPAAPWGESAHETHLNSNGSIDVAPRNEPRTMERAQAIAKAWCEAWSTRLRTRRLSLAAQKGLM